MLYKNTLLLTELFQLTHQYYAKLSLLDEQAFIGFLQIFVEFIEAICKENTNILANYSDYLLQFSYGIENYFWKNPTTIKPFFNAIACLTQYAIESFCIFGYPESYTTFLHHLELIFNNEGIIHAGKQRQAYLLLEQLRQKPSLF